MKLIQCLLLLILFSPLSVFAQKTYISKAWVADNGDDTYKNPILHADYSDPDAIRVGDDFYMISSSFADMPGLPILQSKDLVNWKLVGHALQKLSPYALYNKPQHGCGVWAPGIRYHNSEFYIYFPDPDYGIYLTKAKTITGPWTEPILVAPGKGLEDPCPLWDDDGQAYLVHAYAGSRAGIKSVLNIKKLNSTGDKVTDTGVMVYDGHINDPTIEGPKLYKRNGYYYIFAPAGGVGNGWQVALRSKHIYGPHERKVVMDQGGTAINGPHQGAWVTTQTGEDWFLHFQDKGAYGRVVHLQPMHWVNDWPVIGNDPDGDGKGEPVLTHKKPNVGHKNQIETPAENDEFNSSDLGLQWQWAANPQPQWTSVAPEGGSRRLYAIAADTMTNLWFAPNLLLQKLPAEEFTATTKLHFVPGDNIYGERAGLVVMGKSYAHIAVVHEQGNNIIAYTVCNNADKNGREERTLVGRAADTAIYFRLSVRKSGKCHFSYSFNGKNFTDAGGEFTAQPGRWVGAKMGLFCTGNISATNTGWVDVDWWRVEKNWIIKN